MSARISALDLVAPELRTRLDRMMLTLGKMGIPLRVFESVRTPVRQEELYRRGRDPNADDFGRTVTRAKPYESAHQFGAAVDMVFFVNGRWTWDEPVPGMWDTFHDIAKSNGLTPLSFEKPHVQLPKTCWASFAHGPIATAGWEEWLRRLYA